MQILSATKETKETTLNRKRNLFGLGLTSLIAACGADKAAGGSGDTDTVPFEAKKAKGDLAKAEALTADQANGYTAEIETNTEFMGGTTGQLDAQITKSDDGTSVLLNFPAGVRNDYNTAGIYKLTTDANKYDLVVSSPTIDGSKGGAFIFWNVAGIQDETIGGTSTSTINPHLEIKGAKTDDRIGTYAPEFLQIAGKDNNYDMVIRSEWVDSVGASKGAIYILWDVADYANINKTIDLGNLGDAADTSANVGATAGSLAIYGGGNADQIGKIYAPKFLQLGGVAGENKSDMVINSYLVDGIKGAVYILWDVDSYSGDKTATITLDDSATGVKAESGLLTIKGEISGYRIGTYAPEFLQIAGKADNYDMVIRSEHVDKLATEVNADEGAIYVLWDVAEYAGENININLDSSYINVKDAGLLTIKGAIAEDKIGIYAPEFLQIAGKDNNYDMVIRSEHIDKSTSLVDINKGAIYILWGVADYANTNKTIDLGNLGDAVGTSANVGATAGSLTIYGARGGDQIGTHAPEFLQLGKENDKYDLIIQSEHVDKPATNINEGAIYVLWDIADYAGGNETINLTSLSGDATSGLLTIYGTAGSTLVSSNILYSADSKDSDVDGDGTNDLIFDNTAYTYVLFGNKIATTTTDAEGIEKVDSKTIDLDNIGPLVDKDGVATTNNEGFFSYDFDGTSVGEVGYRFAGSKTFAEVDNEFSPSSLSDKDADLGVWDIA